MFGVFGTMITFGIIAPFTYVANSWNFFGLTFQGIPLKFSLKEILLFASVISATDTVAALTFVKEDQEQKLFSILFGEGVLNDAVCIVLYRIIKMFNFQNEGKYIFYLNRVYFLYCVFYVYSIFLIVFNINITWNSRRFILCNIS